MSKQTINELDKAAVELVWVSSKREDADRKLGMRISQEMQVSVVDIRACPFVSDYNLLRFCRRAPPHSL